jgi:hypothetical protein
MKRFAVFFIAIAGVAAQVRATNLWSNPITGENPSSVNGYTTGQTVASGLTVSGIGRGAGLIGMAASDRYNAAGWAPPVYGSAVNPDSYFYFTLTPNGGFALNLTSFSYTGQLGEGGPTSFTFASSLDGFSSAIGTANASGVISLSGAQFQGLTSGVEFRFYGFGTDNASGTFSINDFSFNGEMVPAQATVPESGPGLAAFACLLVMLAVARSSGIFTAYSVAPAVVRSSSAHPGQATLRTSRAR